MATLVAIAYPGQTTAEQARQTVQGLESGLIIQADQVAAISRDEQGQVPRHGHLGENAIDKEFQEQVRDQVKPGTSALFMIIEKATPDKAIAALKQYGGTVIRTSLSEEDAAKLQEALTSEEPVGAGSQT